jgi:hypothetical protein
MKKNMPMKKVSKALGIDESKMMRYLHFYQGDVSYAPDENKPNLPSLTETERESLDRYRLCWEQLCMGRTEMMIRTMLTKEHGIEDRRARDIVIETYFLYGTVSKADKEGKRRASIEYYRMLAALLQNKDKNYEAAGRMMEKADKLEGLHEQEQMQLDPDQFKTAATLVFVNNLNVLKKNKKDLDTDD